MARLQEQHQDLSACSMYVLEHNLSNAQQKPDGGPKCALALLVGVCCKENCGRVDQSAG